MVARGSGSWNGWGDWRDSSKNLSKGTVTKLCGQRWVEWVCQEALAHTEKTSNTNSFKNRVNSWTHFKRQEQTHRSKVPLMVEVGFYLQMCNLLQSRFQVEFSPVVLAFSECGLFFSDREVARLPTPLAHRGSVWCVSCLWWEEAQVGFCGVCDADSGILVLGTESVLAFIQKWAGICSPWVLFKRSAWLWRWPPVPLPLVFCFCFSGITLANQANGPFGQLLNSPLLYKFCGEMDWIKEDNLIVHSFHSAW